VFNVRWALTPFYFGLVFALFFYYSAFFQVLMELYKHHDANGIMMQMLELVDMVMVANLVKMVITGSYNSFISKFHGYANENISSGMLKVKMGSSIVGVSSIFILQRMVETHVAMATMDWPYITAILAYHSAFLIGVVVLAVIEFWHEKSENDEGKLHLERERLYIERDLRREEMYLVADKPMPSLTPTKHH
jgi:uncharacterized protein (TIGR00645 family)